jgi:hypothetical protein
MELRFTLEFSFSVGERKLMKSLRGGIIFT